MEGEDEKVKDSCWKDDKCQEEGCEGWEGHFWRI